MKRKLGYVARAGAESIDETLQMYDFSAAIPNRKGMKRDIRDIFQNTKVKKATVYRVSLILEPVEIVKRPKKGRK